MIGKSVKIDCKYRRGDRLDQKTNLCGLCNLCWTIRLLPEKYYPRFINEITCDKNASRCLSGHGICQEKFRNLNILISLIMSIEQAYTNLEKGSVYAPFFSIMGAASAMVFTVLGAAYGTA
uniref:Uncharacterized protein n=1 Tax=Romanomermis culicivorax TaxID=13658 RepID=A0A915I2T2_ROMCU